MKARIKATGKIVKVFDAGNGLFEASDGETYFSQGLHFIDDEPDYTQMGCAGRCKDYRKKRIKTK